MGRNIYLREIIQSDNTEIKVDKHIAKMSSGWRTLFDASSGLPSVLSIEQYLKYNASTYLVDEDDMDVNIERLKTWEGKSYIGIDKDIFTDDEGYEFCLDTFT